MATNPYATPYGVIGSLRNTRDTISKMADDYLSEQSAQREGEQRIRALDMEAARIQGQQQIQLTDAENMRQDRIQQALDRQRAYGLDVQRLALEQARSERENKLLPFQQRALVRQEEKDKITAIEDNPAIQEKLKDLTPEQMGLFKEKWGAVLKQQMPVSEQVPYVMDIVKGAPQVMAEEKLGQIEDVWDKQLKDLNGIMPDDPRGIIQTTRKNVLEESSGHVDIMPVVVSKYAIPDPKNPLAEPNWVEYVQAYDPSTGIPPGGTISYVTYRTDKDSMDWTPYDYDAAQQEAQIEAVINAYPEIADLPRGQQVEAINAILEGRSPAHWGIGVTPQQDVNSTSQPSQYGVLPKTTFMGGGTFIGGQTPAIPWERIGNFLTKPVYDIPVTR